MTVAAVVCLVLAALIGGSGAWALARRPAGDINAQVMRLMAPTQLAAAVMLAAAGIVALVAPAPIGPAALAIGAIAAVATVAAGSWQGARFAARQQAAGGCDSAGGCGGCTRVCATE